MKSKTGMVLAVMNVLAWVVFVGLIIKAGAILISYGVSIGNPEGAKNLYKGLDLYNLKQYSFGHYTATVLFMVALEALKASTAYLVIKVLSRIKLESPFTMKVSKHLERISYYILATWVATMLYNGYTRWLSERVEGLQDNFLSGEFILLAGVVFIFSQIFKKGVEIQTENELTV